MLQMRHGMGFRDIIFKEYERIAIPNSKEAYAVVCYFSTFRVKLPRSLILKTLGLFRSTEIQLFQDSTEGLFVEDGYGLDGRHRIITQLVAQHALPSSEAKKAALSMILSNLDTEDEVEELIFFRFFASGVYKRVVNELHRNDALIRSFYEDMKRAYVDKTKFYKKYIMTSWALAERHLQHPDEARECFERAIELDEFYAFAFRQFAWLEHSQGNWREAAQLAEKAADLAPYNFLNLFHCGKILSLNTVQNFKGAKEYLRAAMELEPENALAERTWEQYQTAEGILGYLVGLKEDELLPEHVFNELRPGLASLRGLHGPRSNKVRQRLYGALTYMLQDMQGQLGDLHDKIGDIHVGNDAKLRALISCNLARLQYLAWYRRSEPHDADQIEVLFRESLELNDRDAFTHCWYGTFLKEVRENFPAAKREYEEAMKLASDSKKEWLCDHPLFLNNIALLIMDEVQLGYCEATCLMKAKRFLVKAVERVEETESDFFWPEHSLALCDQLIQDYKLSSNA